MNLRKALSASLQAQIKSALSESMRASDSPSEHARAIIESLDLRPHSQGRKIIITGQYTIGDQQ